MCYLFPCGGWNKLNARGKRERSAKMDPHMLFNAAVLGEEKAKWDEKRKSCLLSSSLVISFQALALCGHRQDGLLAVPLQVRAGHQHARAHAAWPQPLRRVRARALRERETGGRQPRGGHAGAVEAVRGHEDRGQGELLLGQLKLKWERQIRTSGVRCKPWSLLTFCYLRRDPTEREPLRVELWSWDFEDFQCSVEIVMWISRELDPCSIPVNIGLEIVLNFHQVSM